VGTEPFMSMSIELDGNGRIEQVLLVRNPDKLRGIAGPSLGSGG
jgi:RNA polymerase sigma-70 factor (ECF subfamily)